MKPNTVTMLYDVAFLTWSEPNPERIGTSEPAVGKLRLWAKNGDEAIEGAKQIAEALGAEWVNLISADALTGIVLEQILNDPLNPNHKIVYGETTPTEPTGPVLVV